MKRLPLLAAAAVLAMLTTFVCVQGGLWGRPLKMDNRLYFSIAERAASGVPPHVSAPDVKNQLSSLVDAAAIRAGRATGVSDVHAGRLAAVAILIAGIWGTGLTVLELGATPAAAFLGALGVLSFSGLAGHASVGFNPKILLFAVLAWVPWLAARRRHAAAGAMATAAVLCWQPALFACLGAALASLLAPGRLRSFAHCVAGGLVAFVLYESWFAWNGALAAQLFQSYVLPLGSVHDKVDWMDGARFVVFGEEHGADAFGLPALAFALFLLGCLLSLAGLRLPRPGRSPASAEAALVLAVGGVFACVFTAYDHQAEPDRFLLCSYFAASMGVLLDRGVRLVADLLGDREARRLEGAVAVLMLMVSSRGEHGEWKNQETLKQQMDAARVVAMYAEAYGSVWSWGCNHLLSLVHLDNHHPFEHSWDDLEHYVDESTFTPLAHGRLPDVILRRGHIPGPASFADLYREVSVPALEPEKAHLLVRKDLREPVSGLAIAPHEDARHHKDKPKRHRRRDARAG